MVQATPAGLPAHELVKDKRLINSFILANICDTLLTGIALQLPGFMEKGFLAGRMLEQAQGLELLIFKTAITAFMIGIFALAAHHQGRWSHPIKTALRIGTMVVWCVVAWNELNIALALTSII